jgi:hypothetical protein
MRSSGNFATDVSLMVPGKGPTPSECSPGITPSLSVEGKEVLLGPTEATVSLGHQAPFSDQKRRTQLTSLLTARLGCVLLWRNPRGVMWERTWNIKIRAWSGTGRPRLKLWGLVGRRLDWRGLWEGKR